MKKENLPVIVAIALPIVLILAVAGFVYLPNVGGHPQYNFLYTQASWPYAYSYRGGECTIYKNYYEIEGNRLSQKPFASATTTPRDMNYYSNNGAYKPMPAMPVPADSASYCYGYSRVVKKDAPDLYLYDSATDAPRLISYEDAAKLTLVDGVIAPDGYTVSGIYRSSGLFDMFGGGDGYGIYASKKNHRVKVSVPQLEMYGGGDFGFIAWVNK